MIWSTRFVVAFAWSIAIATPAVVKAEGGSLDSVLARLDTLERENRTLRERVRRLEGSSKASAGGASTTTRTSGLATTKVSLNAGQAAPAAELERDSRWAGFYWGASFGGAITRARTSAVETSNQVVPANGFPFIIQGVTTTAEASSQNGVGAMLDLFAGFNVQSGRFVGGLQLEGTIADINFGARGTKSYVYFNAAGPTGQTAVGSFQPHVYGRWMVSGLARAGWLADPSTLLYGIGGWTLGRFEYHNVADNLFFQPSETFFARGVTAGLGVERKIDSNWSLKAEYRFTHFLPTSAGSAFSWTSTAPFVSTQSQAFEGRFANEMHVVRLGVSRLTSVP
jgi:outer membrane immunogenic protein